MARIQGTTKRNVLNGTAANDVINGLAGNDVLSGKNGDDTLHGGEGNDSLNGGNGNDKLNGNAGNDTLAGSAGNDKLSGGAGNDTFDGGAGADEIRGGAGIDTVSYATASQFIALDLDNTLSGIFIPGAAAGDTFFTVENVTGTAFGDFIRGNAASNRLLGGDGDDRLFGRAGADSLYGGDGGDTLSPGDDTAPDILVGGDGFDTVSYADATLSVHIVTFTGFTDGAASGDTFQSIESFFGTPLGDRILVDGGRSAFGSNGDDLLGGSIDATNPTVERLFGGAGLDTFTLRLNAGADRIMDFATNELLRVQSSDFGGVVATSIANRAGTGAATIATPQFIFEQLSSVLYFDRDGTLSNFGPVPVAELVGFSSAANLRTLTSANFDVLFG